MNHKAAYMTIHSVLIRVVGYGLLALASYVTGCGGLAGEIINPFAQDDPFFITVLAVGLATFFGFIMLALVGGFLLVLLVGIGAVVYNIGRGIHSIYKKHEKKYENE